MKIPRDILVAGTGFLLGMLFCYFMVAPKPGPEVSRIAMDETEATMNQALGITTSGTMEKAQAIGQLVGTISRKRVSGVPAVQIKEVFLPWSPRRSNQDPNGWLKPNGTHPRIVPAMGRDGVYDLIDLNYVPDFKIDLD